MLAFKSNNVETSSPMSVIIFGRQAIPMAWDFAEANPFSGSSGSYNVILSGYVKALVASLDVSIEKKSYVKQFDAQMDCGLRNIMISTDPPYYDNISYADLSDFSMFG